MDTTTLRQKTATDEWGAADLDLDAYLHRIGQSRAEPSVASLTALHEAHVRTIPFENIDPLLGPPNSTRSSSCTTEPLREPDPSPGRAITANFVARHRGNLYTTGMRTYPDPPYYVVVFTSRRTPGDNGYSDAAARLGELAAEQPGYLGHDSARSSPELGITVSYWADEESIAAWRNQVEHAPIRDLGRAEWYETYECHVAKMERSYFFERGRSPVSARVGE